MCGHENSESEHAVKYSMWAQGELEATTSVSHRPLPGKQNNRHRSPRNSLGGRVCKTKCANLKDRRFSFPSDMSMAEESDGNITRVARNLAFAQ